MRPCILAREGLLPPTWADHHRLGMGSHVVALTTRVSGTCRTCQVPGTPSFPVLTRTPRRKHIFGENGLTAWPSKSPELGFRWALTLFHQTHFTGNIVY